MRTNFYGGHPYFGQDILTHNKKVFDYLNKIIPMRDCKDHQFITYVERDNQFYNYPLHFKDLNKMPDKKIKKELKQINRIKIKTFKKYGRTYKFYW